MSPARWPTARIGDIAEVNPRRNEGLRALQDDLPVTFVPMAAVDDISGTIASPEIRPLAQVRKGFTPFVEGDVIVAKITPCMQNGKAAIAKGLSNRIGFGSTEFHILRPGPEVLPEWLWYFVRQQSFREEAQRYFRGSAGQQRVPAEFLLQHEIPKPAIDEQRRIVARMRECLQRVYEIRKLRGEAMPEAHALPPALVESVADPSWPTTRLGDIASEIRNGWSGKKPVQGHPARVLRLSCVRGLIIERREAKEQCVSLDVISSFALRRDDVFLVRGNGSKHLVGRSAIAVADEPETIFNDLLIRVRFNKKMLPDFANLMFHTAKARQQIESLAKTAAGIWKINQRMVASLNLPCPELALQEEATERFAHFRKAADEIQASLLAADPEVLTQAILLKAFAGEF